MPPHALVLEPAPLCSPSAIERLSQLERRFPGQSAELLAACKLAPDPDLALTGVDRFADAAGALPREPGLLQTLALLCGASRMIAALLYREPSLLRRSARPARR